MPIAEAPETNSRKETAPPPERSAQLQMEFRHEPWLQAFRGPPSGGILPNQRTGFRERALGESLSKRCSEYRLQSGIYLTNEKAQLKLSRYKIGRASLQVILHSPIRQE